jgi:hypothetical protein
MPSVSIPDLICRRFKHLREPYKLLYEVFVEEKVK